MKLRSLLSPALAALLAFAAGSVTRADEGMWLYSAHAVPSTLTCRGDRL